MHKDSEYPCKENNPGLRRGVPYRNSKSGIEHGKNRDVKVGE
jgi:hypothetical protein